MKKPQLRGLVIEPIDGSAKRYRVFLDGVDISSSCNSITIQMDADRPPIVNIVMFLRPSVKVDADVTIEIMEANREETG